MKNIHFPTPSTSSVFWEQTKLILQVRRRQLLWILVPFYLFVFIIELGGGVPGLIDRADDGRGIYLSWVPATEMGFNGDMGTLLFGWTLTLCLGLIWPVFVWSGNAPEQRDYHWTMPIGKTKHDLIRFAAGGCILAAIVLMFLLEASLIRLLPAHTNLFQALSAGAWFNLLAGPLLYYTWATVAAVWSNRPGLTIIAAVFGMMVVVVLSKATPPSLLATAVDFLLQGPYSIQSAAAFLFLTDISGLPKEVTPFQGLVATGFWLCAGFGAIVFASRRSQNNCA